MYKIYALINGIIIALMIMVNGFLAAEVGKYFSVIIIHLIGLLTIGIFFIVIKEETISLRNIPKFLFIAGAIGVLNVFFTNIAFIHLGITITLGVELLGQLITSNIVDHFGLFGMTVHKFEPRKLLGFLIICLGIIAMMLG